MLTCTLCGHKAVIWRTTDIERDDQNLLYLVSEKDLRKNLLLEEGDRVVVHVAHEQTPIPKMALVIGNRNYASWSMSVWTFMAMIGFSQWIHNNTFLCTVAH